MEPSKIDDLHNLCKVVGQIKSQLIEELPHYGSQGLFFNNDSITTGQLNNKTEIKIHLLSGKLLYFHNEEGHLIDLKNDDIYDKLQKISKKYNFNLPQITLNKIPEEQFSLFHEYAVKAIQSLELFRMTLDGKFTMVHLWPDHFDFSVEWFTGNKDEQIGTGISPGDEQYKEPYLYMNPWPFDEKVKQNKLPIGIWHTSGWNGIKVEWNDLAKCREQEITQKINGLFLIAKRIFVKERI